MTRSVVYQQHHESMRFESVIVSACSLHTSVAVLCLHTTVQCCLGHVAVEAVFVQQLSFWVVVWMLQALLYIKTVWSGL